MFKETIKITNSLYFYTGDNLKNLISLSSHRKVHTFKRVERIKKTFWRFMTVQNTPPCKKKLTYRYFRMPNLTKGN